MWSVTPITEVCRLNTLPVNQQQVQPPFGHFPHCHTSPGRRESQPTPRTAARVVTPGLERRRAGTAPSPWYRSRGRFWLRERTSLRSAFTCSLARRRFERVTSYQHIISILGFPAKAISLFFSCCDSTFKSSKTGAVSRSPPLLQCRMSHVWRSLALAEIFP